MEEFDESAKDNTHVERAGISVCVDLYKSFDGSEDELSCDEGSKEDDVNPLKNGEEYEDEVDRLRKQIKKD